MSIQISIVVPLYKCSESIMGLYNGLNKILNELSYSFEIILVVDKSPDRDWQIVKELAEKDKNLKGLNLNMNYGQHKAIKCGINHASGEIILVMDGDMQDDPYNIKQLTDELAKGFDIVFAIRNKIDVSKTNIIKSFFYFLLKKVLKIDFIDGIGTFCVFYKESLQKISDKNYLEFLPGLFYDKSLNAGLIEISKNIRTQGRTSYSFIAKLLLGTEILCRFTKPVLKNIVCGSLIFILVSVFLTGFWVWPNIFYSFSSFNLLMGLFLLVVFFSLSFFLYVIIRVMKRIRNNDLIVNEFINLV
ncbi:MAG: glycosyltransferase family 2 protein [Bacteroidales bacterium]|nr:glycosyltransferase family 2 protein [Bacteroidales bacterium]